MNNFSWVEFEEKVNQWCDLIESKAKQKKKDIYLWFKQCNKYYKIFIVKDKDEKVHAFVDRETGNIYKPKTKSSPNKTFSKYNLFLDNKNLMDDCEFTGNYLKP